MASHTRIQNVTRRYSMKRNQAIRAVENCSAVWVEYGVSIRDLTYAESIAARNQQAATREPIPFAELPGLIYRAAIGNEAQQRKERILAMEANQWARLQTA